MDKYRHFENPQTPTKSRSYCRWPCISGGKSTPRISAQSDLNTGISQIVTDINDHTTPVPVFTKLERCETYLKLSEEYWKRSLQTLGRGKKWKIKSMGPLIFTVPFCRSLSKGKAITLRTTSWIKFRKCISVIGSSSLETSPHCIWMGSAALLACHVRKVPDNRLWFDYDWLSIIITNDHIIIYRRYRLYYYRSWLSSSYAAASRRATWPPCQGFFPFFFGGDPSRSPE